MKPPSSVLLLSDPRDPRLDAEIEQLRRFLEERSVVVVLAEERSADELRECGAQLVIVLGGDGTFLRAVHHLQHVDIPFLGIRFGTFGYLAELEPESWEDGLERVLEGRSRIERWMRLRCRLRREDGRYEDLGLALNEVVLSAAEVARMVEVGLRIDGEDITRFRGDGFILAAPAGSTAHSLAGGGPIVEPDDRCLLLTPLASQALTFRPLVVRSHRKVEMVVHRARHGTAVTLDGRETVTLPERAVIEVRDAQQDFSLLRVTERSRFRTLRERLHWGSPLIEE